MTEVSQVLNFSYTNSRGDILRVFFVNVADEIPISFSEVLFFAAKDYLCIVWEVLVSDRT